jgi:methionyl-tRNA formyltransferase
VVVAFRMLPEVVWAMPPLGTINLHASLLPRYRGAAPINWAIIRGETETGLTTFFIRQEIDTGNLLFQTRLPIGKNETAGSLHDRMKLEGARLVLRTVQAVEAGAVSPQPQDDRLATSAPKLSHETNEIDLGADRHAVHNFIRGLSPYPGAWTTFRWAAEIPAGQAPDGSMVKLLETRVSDKPAGHPAGFFVVKDKNQLLLSVGDGYVEVLELQAAGRRRMDAASFLNGLRM